MLLTTHLRAGRCHKRRICGRLWRCVPRFPAGGGSRGGALNRCEMVLKYNADPADCEGFWAGEFWGAFNEPGVSQVAFRACLLPRHRRESKMSSPSRVLHKGRFAALRLTPWRCGRPGNGSFLKKDAIAFTGSSFLSAAGLKSSHAPTDVPTTGVTAMG